MGYPYFCKPSYIDVFVHIRCVYMYIYIRTVAVSRT